jgi:hypothetical protein
MNFHRIATACALTVSGFLIAGCASDPGKKVNAAEAELTDQKVEARGEERDSNAEATQRHESDHAESAADKHAATTDAKRNVDAAHADLAQDRRDVDAKTKERIAKIDAKEKELKTKSSKLTGKKAADFKAHHAVFTNQRSEAGTKIAALETTSTHDWASAKKDLEMRLGNLEDALTRMEQDL